MNIKYLKALFLNKETRKLFEIKKKFLQNVYLYNDLLKNSTITEVDGDTINITFTTEISIMELYYYGCEFNIQYSNLSMNGFEKNSDLRKYHLLLNNSTSAALFGLGFDIFYRAISYNELLEKSKLILMDDKKSILYVIFDKPYLEEMENSKDKYIHYLCKLDIEENKFSYVGLHRTSSNEKDNLKYANESYLVDYMNNYDRNMSLHFGNCEYI